MLPSKPIIRLKTAPSLPRQAENSTRLRTPVLSELHKWLTVAATSFAVLVPSSQSHAEPGFNPRQVISYLGQDRVYLKEAKVQLGSTPEQSVAAIADCARETLPQNCAPSDFELESPAHEVSLSAFWLDRYEVSVARYQHCVDLQHCEPVPFIRGAERFRRPELPITLVRYQDAQAFCRFMGGALPSEAQFERAARGTSGHIYPWGNLYHQKRANHGRFAFDGTSGVDGVVELAAVNTFAEGVTPEGVFNLAGNAEEWVADRFAPYPSEASRNPLGPSELSGITERVVRGGDFLSPAPYLRSAARKAVDPNARSVSRGFRCAYSSGPPGTADTH